VAKHGENFDAFALYHDVAGRGIAHNIRERLVRRDKGKWVNRIHENLSAGPQRPALPAVTPRWWCICRTMSPSRAATAT
jgi:hypothetical protein